MNPNIGSRRLRARRGRRATIAWTERRPRRAAPRRSRRLGPPPSTKREFSVSAAASRCAHRAPAPASRPRTPSRPLTRPRLATLHQRLGSQALALTVRRLERGAVLVDRAERARPRPTPAPRLPDGSGRLTPWERMHWTYASACWRRCACCCGLCAVCGNACARLVIEESTVKTHVKRILMKLDAGSRSRW